LTQPAASGRSKASEDGDRFVLEIVPVGENVRTARLFGASIARHFKCDEEQVEDLKLALSEAVSRAFRNRPATMSSTPVRVTALKAGAGLTFTIDGPPGEAPPADSGEPTEEELIQALFPDASFDAASGATDFTLFLPAG
jgi:anti-sigma regulatory factor (Ser/Thr protein kinase)